MKPQGKQDTVSEEPRRSTRKRKQLECDYYVMSVGGHEYAGEWDIREEDYSPKQARRRRRDSEDFEGRVTKKKTNVNRIVNLLDWKRNITLPQPPAESTYKLHKVKNVAKADLVKFGTKFQGILVNIKWKDQPPFEYPGVSVEEFRSLNLEDVMENGIVFIWSEPIVLNPLMDVMEEKGFTYVQNLQIGLLDLEKGRHQLSKCCSLPAKEVPKINKKRSKLQTTSEDTIQFPTEETQFIQKSEFLCNMDKLGNLDPDQILLKYKTYYSAKSKLELMMFRKFDGKKNTLELRHQRTPDTVFDIVSPKTLAVDKLTKNFIYEMIQTLLPTSQEKLGTFKLMELWGSKDSPRAGWVVVADK